MSNQYQVHVGCWLSTKGDKYEEASGKANTSYYSGPEPITPNEGTSNQNATKSVIEGHVSAIKELLKEPSNRNLIKSILLDFDDIQDSSDEETQDDMKEKAKARDEDLSKPFKEVLKCHFTRRIVEFSSPGHRMPANVKIYDGMGDPKDHMGLFVRIGNQGEWPMPVYVQACDGCSQKKNDGCGHFVVPTTPTHLFAGTLPWETLCYEMPLSIANSRPLFLASHPLSWVYCPRSALLALDTYGSS
nr:hypothetical protein [Tanacetum cinerariifolium]